MEWQTEFEKAVKERNALLAANAMLTADLGAAGRERDAAQAEAERLRAERDGCRAEVKSLNSYHDAAVTEVERLRQWQREAIIVSDQWDKVYEAAGKPGKLGDSMAMATKAEVERLRADYRSYHDEIGGIFLAAGQTPYKICKQIWALHADRSVKMAVEEK